MVRYTRALPLTDGVREDAHVSENRGNFEY